MEPDVWVAPHDGGNDQRVDINSATVAQMAEAAASKAVRCGFKSRPWHKGKMPFALAAAQHASGGCDQPIIVAAYERFGNEAPHTVHPRCGESVGLSCGP